MTLNTQKWTTFNCEYFQNSVFITFTYIIEFLNQFFWYYLNMCRCLHYCVWSRDLGQSTKFTVLKRALYENTVQESVSSLWANIILFPLVLFLSQILIIFELPWPHSSKLPNNSLVETFKSKYDFIL